MDQKQNASNVKSTQNESFPANSSQCTAAGGGQHTTNDGGDTLSGAPPSNTAPSNCNNPENNTKAIRTGIDSLYLSYQGVVNSEIDGKLADLKLLAQAYEPHLQGHATFQLNDHCFEVKATGRQRHAYVLQDNWFQIHVASSNSTRIPMVYAQISSELLSRSGIVHAVEALDKIVHQLGDCSKKPTISRVDLCVDFTTPIDFFSIPIESWVSRSTKMEYYFDKKILTGYTFGKGGVISCRLYNKTIEVIHTKKEFFYPIWEQSGWDGQSDVWRLEFQFRRDVLREFLINTVDDLLEKITSLWQYSTSDWLKLTIPSTTDKTQSRWPLNPMWKLLVHAAWEFNSGEPITRVRKQQLPHEGYLFINGISPIISIMARDSLTDFNDGVAVFLQELKKYHQKRSRHTGESLDEYASGKAFKKARRYNTTIINKKTVQSDKEDE